MEAQLQQHEEPEQKSAPSDKPLDAGAPSTLISLPHEPYTRASPAPHPPHTPPRRTLKQADTGVAHQPLGQIKSTQVRHGVEIKKL